MGIRWPRDMPEDVGYYYFARGGHDRPLLCHAWARAGGSGKLVTNWDDGAPIDDECFRGGWWWGPLEIIKPPPPPPDEHDPEAGQGAS